MDKLWITLEKEGGNCPKDYKKTKTYKIIKESLLEQLRAKGNDTPFFNDLVCDYMDMWVVKNMLIEDIDENGVFIIYQHGKNQSGRTKNNSIQELTKVNAQMLKILDQLKIKVQEALLEEDDEL